jgi:hypothetical protein
MKLSTINWLSKAIAVPLFIVNLNIIAPASAEQIARSRSISSGESRPRAAAPLPAVTDLNLVVPASEVESIDRAEASNSITERKSHPSRNSSVSIVIKDRSSKAKPISKHRSVVASSINSVRSLTIEQPGQSRSVSKRKNLLAMNIDRSTETIVRTSQKIQSSSKPRIAAVSPAPLGGNYLKLVRDPNKGTNDVGNPIYTLEAYVNGQKYHTVNAVSGTATTQNADRNRGNNFAPLPDGLYSVSDRIIPGSIPEVGRTFIGIFPKFETGRNDLGIHLDPSFNKRNGYDGTAGCIGIATAQERDTINEFVNKYRPHNLLVTIAASEN